MGYNVKGVKIFKNGLFVEVVVVFKVVVVC